MLDYNISRLSRAQRLTFLSVGVDLSGLRELHAVALQVKNLHVLYVDFLLNFGEEQEEQEF